MRTSLLINQLDEVVSSMSKMQSPVYWVALVLYIDEVLAVEAVQHVTA